MAPPPGPYSGTSTLALVARASAFSVGLVYGNWKLKYLQMQAKAKSQKKAEAKARAVEAKAHEAEAKAHH